MEESNMAFADHSGFEFDGGSVKLLLARDLNSVLIANVATTGDGAVLTETRGGDYFIPSLDQNSDLNLQPTLIECSAKLGG
ncbi:hypothetical protein BLNAU_21327 [Blattamonas nauphoetae]|uniref:Uncharacterized protein n=1 Tax=Blattamonas nauphoetae TaxID=2049346 RepID=A0ABQ9WW81_9EUKA|nr:hypothetical protein BLNAU_21327 [Blattamonas nauphoetae]